MRIVGGASCGCPECPCPNLARLVAVTLTALGGQAGVVRGASDHRQGNVRMSPAFPLLRFAWWNVHDFAHFDPNRAGSPRWPSSRAEYDAKCARVDAALRHLVAHHPPDVLGLCEITERAADELRGRLFPDYRLIYPQADTGPLRVAVLARRGLTPLLPLWAEVTPRTTREMPVVNFRRANNSIQFIFCHWTAFGDHSPLYRERAAEAVAERAYTLLHGTGTRKTAAHVVVVGDLNEEPFGDLFRDRLAASRDREPSIRPLHAADHDTRRVRLYNPTWRLLGERYPHNSPLGTGHHAGTYYNGTDRAWHTYDQVLVSGSLLGSTPPSWTRHRLG